MEKLLVIDVGGTNIKYSTWDGSSLGEVKEVATPLDTMDNFLSVLAKMVKETEPINGIAFSYPGFIDTQTGIKHGGGNLRYTDNISITDTVEQAFNLPVAIDNDSKCATLAELKLGNLKGVDNAATLILGTGVGGTVVVDGKIVRGRHLIGGEFSFIKTDINNMDSFSAIAGSVCSTTGLIKEVERTTGLENLDGRKIFKLIQDGNKEAMEGLKKFCQNLCWLIYNLEVITDPDVFIIGGGISAQSLLLELLTATVEEEWIKSGFGVPVPELRVCKFRNDANLIGAALNFEMHFGQN